MPGGSSQEVVHTQSLRFFLCSVFMDIYGKRSSECAGYNQTFHLFLFLTVSNSMKLICAKSANIIKSSYKWRRGRTGKKYRTTKMFLYISF